MAIKDIMDAGEVAAVLGISATAVHGLCSRGTLPSEWAGSKRVWRGATIRRYLEDAAAQARRRAGSGQGPLFSDDEIRATDSVNRSIELQAPAGFDPTGRLRGGGRP